jgi:hypothetical protein
MLLLFLLFAPCSVKSELVIKRYHRTVICPVLRPMTRLSSATPWAFTRAACHRVAGFDDSIEMLSRPRNLKVGIDLLAT